MNGLLIARVGEGYNLFAGTMMKTGESGATNSVVNVNQNVPVDY